VAWGERTSKEAAAKTETLTGRSKSEGALRGTDIDRAITEKREGKVRNPNGISPNGVGAGSAGRKGGRKKNSYFLSYEL